MIIINLKVSVYINEFISYMRVNYYYGIRNNKITKLKKEIDNGFEHAHLKKKIKDLSDEFKQYKIGVDSINNINNKSKINN